MHIVGSFLFFSVAGALLAAESTGADWLSQLPPELELKLPLWERTAEASVQGGYKDNVTLAAERPQGSAFLQSNLELMWLRLPVDSWQMHLFLYGEDTRYFSADAVEKENSAIAQFEVKQYGRVVTASLAVNYLYQDQVLDLSTTETNQALQVQGHSLSLKPAVRRALGSNTWTEMRLTGARQWLNEPLDDYWEVGPQWVLGQSLAHRIELSLSYEYTRRAYDTRTAPGPDGQPSDEPLLYHQHAVEGRVRNYFDAARQWRSTLRLGYQKNLDNGSGYFDYHRWYISHQLRFRRNQWEASLQIRLNHYDYPVQPATGPETRQRLDATLEARLERTLPFRFKWFVAYQREQAFSNDALEEYTVNQFASGLSREF